MQLFGVRPAQRLNYLFNVPGDALRPPRLLEHAHRWVHAVGDEAAVLQQSALVVGVVQVDVLLGRGRALSDAELGRAVAGETVLPREVLQTQHFVGFRGEEGAFKDDFPEQAAQRPQVDLLGVLPTV